MILADDPSVSLHLLNAQIIREMNRGTCLPFDQDLINQFWGFLRSKLITD